MALGLGTTFGAGTTDVIIPVTTAMPVDYTYSIWFYRNGNGGGGTGRIYDKASNGLLVYDSGNSRMQFTRNFASATATYVFSGGNVGDTGRWIHMMITNATGTTDGTEVGAYVDGGSVSTTRTVAPSGALDTTTGSWFTGNRNDGLRNFDGMFAEIAIYNRILLPEHALCLGKGRMSPLFFTEGLVEYMPMRGEPFSSKGPYTNTGTKNQQHAPNILYPDSAIDYGELARRLGISRSTLLLLGVG